MARQTWLIDFASLFKDTRPILTPLSLQPWLVRRNKNVDTLFQQMRNDKCINHSSSAALRFQFATVPGWMATPLMTTSQEASTEAWWHCAKMQCLCPSLKSFIVLCVLLKKNCLKENEINKWFYNVVCSVIALLSTYWICVCSLWSLSSTLKAVIVSEVRAPL